MNKKRKIFQYAIIQIATISIIIAFFSLDYKNIVYGYNYLNINTNVTQESVKIIQENSESILAASNQFNLNPIAISGIIVAENSLNNSYHKDIKEQVLRELLLNKDEDEIKKMINNQVYSSVNPSKTNKSLYYKINNPLTWSIGICQISIIRAIELEIQLCKLEKRDIRTYKELLIKLLDPSENIKYCALELKMISEYYRDVLKINLKQRPEIITSAYNIGLNIVSNRYENHMNRKPKPNSFGLFIKHNQSKIQIILLGKYEAKQRTINKTLSNP